MKHEMALSDQLAEMLLQGVTAWRSGARVPRACHAPLNSSSSATRFRISGVILSVSGEIITPNSRLHPFMPPKNYAPQKAHPITPIQKPKQRSALDDTAWC